MDTKNTTLSISDINHGSDFESKPPEEAYVKCKSSSDDILRWWKGGGLNGLQGVFG